MVWYEYVGIVWAVLIVLLLTWSYFNQDELTVGDIVLGVLLAPIAFVYCYADWNTKVIVWRRKEK